MDKINIYVPDYIGNIIKKDSEFFEIYKDSHTTIKEINNNKFLSMLILGFYEEYSRKNKEIFDSIMKILDYKGLSQEEREEIAKKILKSVVQPEIPNRKGKNPVRLSLKPTKSTEALINQILYEIGSSEYISQYFCRMIVDYCSKPISERERIIFKDNFDELMMACETGRNVSFRTTWNKELIHEVIPYKVVVGSEERFNYLLCAEYNKITGLQEARAYRLNRIEKINFNRKNDTIDKLVINHLNLMMRNEPQYMINEEEETCVRMTGDGIRAYNRIYYGRPHYERIEEDNNNMYNMYFSCSEDQLFNYFRRLNAKDAEVIYPNALRKRLNSFHKESYDVYKEEKNG